GQVAGRPDRLLRGRRRRPRTRPPLPRLPVAPRRPLGRVTRRPPPGRGAADAVRAGHARRALRAGAAPPRPRPATARHAPHHRGRRSLLPRPAPRGTHRRRRLGRDRRRRRALAAGPRRVASAAPPRGGGPGSALPVLGPRAPRRLRRPPGGPQARAGPAGVAATPALPRAPPPERRPRPLARSATIPATPAHRRGRGAGVSAYPGAARRGRGAGVEATPAGPCARLRPTGGRAGRR